MLLRAIKKVLPRQFRGKLRRTYDSAAFKIEILKKRILYFGIRYRCVMCNAHLRKMLPFGIDQPVNYDLKVVGAGLRQNALCPICGSLDRERHVYLFMKRMTEIFSDRTGCGKIRLLHIAPEWNLGKKLSQEKGIEYISADIASPIAAVKMDIRRIPFEDRSFDAVVCNHVLEHVEEDRMAMAEISRILKEGGWAILQTPISLVLEETLEDPNVVSPEEREEVFGQDDHVRIYARDYLKRLEEAGFSVREYHAQDYLKPREIDRFCIIANESIFFCRAPSSK